MPEKKVLRLEVVERKQVSSEDKKAWLLRMVDYVEEL